ncbi:MAG: aa3-type cytochrome c oxidase subunit IV [Pseudorhodobacter sp.]|nr:aa3-type cytochrome c oxidase subunit IV [Pseudorhodobacter sp.]
MAEHKPGNTGEFKPGSMDIRAQEKTFALFIRFATWGGILTVLSLILLALADA